MSFNNSVIIIIIVVAFAAYLIYSQRKQNKQISQFAHHQYCPTCRNQSNQKLNQTIPLRHGTTQEGYLTPTMLRRGISQDLVDYTISPRHTMSQDSINHPSQRELTTNLNTQKSKEIYNKQPPQITNVIIDNDNDPYSDLIKKQDLYMMYDPLTYPQLRLSREVLEKYNEYYERNGMHPSFNQMTQPNLFDNPILNGILIKYNDENEPFSDNVPSSIPLFRVKSAKNTNRFFYYIIDNRHAGKIELKIPLDHIKVNGIRYNNADYYGIPELFDGDLIEHIPIYPDVKFKVILYKTYHFP